uniref:Uncharacterized protein n=1 Tax=Oryza brachyantha TaxID=4533 RepID=J3KZQ0_ORYBR
MTSSNVETSGYLVAGWYRTAQTYVAADAEPVGLVVDHLVAAPPGEPLRDRVDVDGEAADSGGCHDPMVPNIEQAPMGTMTSDIEGQGVGVEAMARGEHAINKIANQSNLSINSLNPTDRTYLYKQIILNTHRSDLTETVCNPARYNHRNMKIDELNKPIDRLLRTMLARTPAISPHEPPIQSDDMNLANQIDRTEPKQNQVNQNYINRPNRRTHEDLIKK